MNKISSFTLHLLVRHFWLADILHQRYQKHFILNSFCCITVIRPWGSNITAAFHAVPYNYIRYTVKNWPRFIHLCYAILSLFSWLMNICLPRTLSKVNGLHRQNRKINLCTRRKIAARDAQEAAKRNKAHWSFPTSLTNFYIPLPHYCKLISVRWAYKVSITGYSNVLANSLQILLLLAI